MGLPEVYGQHTHICTAIFMGSQEAIFAFLHFKIHSRFLIFLKITYYPHIFTGTAILVGTFDQGT